eukprot:gene14934-20988_t
MAIDLTSGGVDQSEIGPHHRLRGMLHFLGGGNRREKVRKLKVPFLAAQPYISSMLVLPNLEEISMGGYGLSGWEGHTMREVYTCMLLSLPVLAPQTRRLSVDCILDATSAKALAQLQHLEELSGRLRGHLKTTLQLSSSLRRVHLVGEQDRFRETPERRTIEKIQSAGLKELRMQIGKVAYVELDCPDLELLQFDVHNFYVLAGLIPFEAMVANIIRGLKRHSPKIRLLEFCFEEKSCYVGIIPSAKCIKVLHQKFPSQVATRAVEEYEVYKKRMGRVCIPCNEANLRSYNRDSASIPEIQYQMIISISPKDVSFDSISNLHFSGIGNDGDEYF